MSFCARLLKRGGEFYSLVSSFLTFSSFMWLCFFVYSAGANSTDITVYKLSTDSNTTFTLSEVGEFLTLSTKENEVMHIITSGPVIVAQYTQSGR